MKILFAVPFYKNVEFLEQTLNSVLNQTDQRWEMVVLDDSTSIDEANAARTLVNRLNEPRVRYLRNPSNLGMAANWNQGLMLGNDYALVSILHADDCLLPDFVGSVLIAAEQYSEASAFFCKTEIVSESGRHSFSFPDWYKQFLLPKSTRGVISMKGMPAIRHLISGNFIFCPTLCFRPQKIGGFQFLPNYKMVLDLDLILKLLLTGHELIGLYGKPLYQYRRHSENATNALTRSLVRFQEEADLYDRLADDLRKRGEFGLAKAAFSKRIVKMNLLFQIFKSSLRLNFKDMKKYASFLMHLN